MAAAASTAEPPASADAAFRLPEVLAVELARALADRIVFLELAPGARITEEEVCGSYKVSRSPVREAFRLLEAEGLVIRASRRGVRVTPVGLADLEDVYTCRIALEGLAAAAAVRHLGTADLEALHALMARMEAALGARDARAFFDHNVAFLRRIHEAAHNPTLMRLLGGIDRQTLRYRYIAHRHADEMLGFVLDSYRRIHDALAKRDAAAARRETETTMRGARAIIARVLVERFPDVADA